MREVYIGLMSGTSLDGVDAVMVDFGDSTHSVLGKHYTPYPHSLRKAIQSLLSPGENELHRAGMVAVTLAELYATAVNALLDVHPIQRNQVAAIGCHGQTVRHQPNHGYTLQLNHPALLAELTQIQVITDFRSRDIAAKGQGAPLVPAFHDAVFRSPDHHRVILNLGGIANITDLEPGKPTRGFDTGPANLLLDAWTQYHARGTYDANGDWARSGNVIGHLLDRLLRHSFLTLSPPKSCGAEDFNLPWLGAQLQGGEPPEDVQATLCRFTAHSIADAIHRYCTIPDEIYVCGGGAHNKHLLEQIEALLPKCTVQLTDTLGLDVDWVEAVAFAWLARQHCLRKPGNLPDVTGALGQRVLGASYPS